MLESIGSDRGKVVLAEWADRWIRDLMVSEVIHGQFHDLGGQVVSTESSTALVVSDENTTRSSVRRIPGPAAQFEKPVTVLTLRVVLDRIRKAKRRREGREYFGTRSSEASILCRIRQVRRKQAGRHRASPADIAQILDNEPWNQPI